MSTIRLLLFFDVRRKEFVFGFVIIVLVQKLRVLEEHAFLSFVQKGHAVGGKCLPCTQIFGAVRISRKRGHQFAKISARILVVTIGKQLQILPQIIVLLLLPLFSNQEDPLQRRVVLFMLPQNEASGKRSVNISWGCAVTPQQEERGHGGTLHHSSVRSEDQG